MTGPTEAQLERVARAICAKDYGDRAVAMGHASLDSAVDLNWSRFLPHARAAIAAHEAAAWQPIETAPRDGTDLLAWDRSEGRRIARYAPEMAERTSYVWFDKLTHLPHCPSHWMPLPAAPGDAP